MSDSQKHGVWLEEKIQMSGRFPGSEILVGQRNNLHDIPIEFDPARKKEDRLPSSVKSLVNTSGTICLADALRFFDITHTSGVRLVVGRFRQKGDHKIFHQIVEFTLRAEHVQALWGSISRQEIVALRDSIKWSQIEASRAGDKMARKVAKVHTDALSKRRGLVTLNRKIGSKHHERRIQCSITLRRLTKLLEDEPGGIVRDQVAYGALTLPFSTESTARENALPADRPRKEAVKMRKATA